MPRRPAGRVRSALPPPAGSLTAPPVPGLSRRALGAVVRWEAERDDPGAVARAFASWRRLVDGGGRPLRPNPDGCGVDACCGDPRSGRELLESALRGLPRGAAAELARQVGRLDERFIARTLPDPLASRSLPWWQRRA